MRWRTTALTLFFTLGVAGLVCADDTGNWFTRMFSLGSKKADSDKKTPGKGDADQSDEWVPGSPKAKPRNQQAAQDWQRRLDVCTRLREIANETGDLALERKAEELEKRVFEAYKAANNRNDTAMKVIGEVSVKDLKALDKAGKGKR